MNGFADVRRVGKIACRVREMRRSVGAIFLPTRGHRRDTDLRARVTRGQNRASPRLAAPPRQAILPTLQRADEVIE
jgi:hypothetical protein